LGSYDFDPALEKDDAGWRMNVEMTPPKERHSFPSCLNSNLVSSRRGQVQDGFLGRAPTLEHLPDLLGSSPIPELLEVPDRG
jgi:hypothetical protein